MEDSKKRTHIVLKVDDVVDGLTKKESFAFAAMVAKVCDHRGTVGKDINPVYTVVNHDEEYIDEVLHAVYVGEGEDKNFDLKKGHRVVNVRSSYDALAHLKGVKSFVDTYRQQLSAAPETKVSSVVWLYGSFCSLCLKKAIGFAEILVNPYKSDELKNGGDDADRK